ncbi:hypothetical protein B9Z19DRAFT_1137419 [Tuber borchii]|uniref:Uncharacterized protein n=1 Tax=Tuber borchii TaxID=42251 RepID=A0A2T6ZAM9_TUBBO|nr:hypothetical protein B9Z19DRAFT_1137419 [Tuber borchii]
MGSPVAAGGVPAVGLAKAATFDISHTRDPISGCTRRNPSMPTGREDCTFEYQLTAQDMEADLDMTVYEEWEEDEEDQDVDFINLCESDEEDGNGSEDSDRFYGEEMIYEEGEEEEEETDDDGDNANNNDYHDDRERERSSDSPCRSVNGDVDMIGVGEISGLSLETASRDLDRSNLHYPPSGFTVMSQKNYFRASTQEIGERLLGRAITPKDFFISLEDPHDSIEYIITKRKQLLAGNAHLSIDLKAATREDAEEQGIDLKEMDRIDHEMDRQALLNQSWQQFPRTIKKEPEN